MKRQSGVLLPVSALPGPFSCGNFGKSAYDFVDFLAEGGFSWWQVLPFCVPDDTRSPYMSPASLAGDPAYLDPDTLVKKGLLTEAEVAEARQRIEHRVEAERLGEERAALLARAVARVTDSSSVDAFFASRPELARQCDYLGERDGRGSFYHRFLQYEFHLEWSDLKRYANEKGVSILGDLPFYVSPGSADVRHAPEAFLLDEKGRPLKVAGVPPDYFSADGQLWGNPLYRWEEMEKDGFLWWKKRLEYALAWFDGVRLDHFRAVSEYFAIPAHSPRASEGVWETGPGMKLIRALQEVAGDRLIVAENLGIIDERVSQLLEESGFPGMAVFQFGFDGNPENPHLPHNYTKNTVAYTGTHDNNTLLGFMWESSDAVRREVLTYVGWGGEDWNRSYESILRTLLRSSARLVIFPVQDLLGFGADTRLNTPGTAEDNWVFRLREASLKELDPAPLREMNRLYSRL